MAIAFIDLTNDKSISSQIYHFLYGDGVMYGISKWFTITIESVVGGHELGLSKGFLMRSQEFQLLIKHIKGEL